MTHEEIVEDLKALEQKIKILRRDYELYFNGLEKKEPLFLKEQVQRMIRKFLREPIRNPALKFKFESLQATFNTFNTYWNRVTMQMEQGLDPRSRFRLRQREERASQPLPTAPSPAPAPTSDPKTIYEQFLQARAQTKESTRISLPQMEKLLQKQEEKLRKKYGCREVEFRVVIEEGKTKLKGIPKGIPKKGERATP
ncbi:MAG: hypothetical protein D6795_15500 [Deltaproteobacteria bacterium]|nr:MAG: hypothetical protein D6795_15500 [Deltaproteobacteria bacterium]